ncbi:hypothetical protein MMC25_002096 [Agyrium rufum]|nr:hypothetical protein [Agyrium rufum]
MPRVTRAALRSRELDDLAQSVPLPASPQPIRAVLGEITNNQEDVGAKAAKKARAKSKRAKESKRLQRNHSDDSTGSSEVLEDENQSGSSSAVEDACDELRIDIKELKHQSPMRDHRPSTPLSEAAQEATRQLSPHRHGASGDAMTPNTVLTTMIHVDADDSFAAVINSRTPAMPMPEIKLFGQVQEDEENHTPKRNGFHNDKDDSFVDQIITRSPMPPKMRIEDSVEAIDALEEAIEQADAAIPKLNDVSDSPIKVSRTRKAPVSAPNMISKPITRKTISSSARKPMTSNTTTTTRVTRQSPTKASADAPSQSRDFHMGHSSAVPRSKETLKTNASKTTAKVSPTITKPTTTTARKQPARVSSLHKTPFVPQKSAKPPTRSTFSLPGEAISHKLKAQREEKLKLETEEAEKRRMFKARPVRKSQAPSFAIKETTTSRARMSSVGGLNGQTLTTYGVPSAGWKAGARILSVSSTKANVGGQAPLSTPTPVFKPVQVTKRSPAPSAVKPVLPKSKPLPTAKPRTSSLTTHTASTIGASRTSSIGPSSLAGTNGASKGKEVFNRAKAMKVSIEQAKRDKEDAARKARVEAAERGRLASREWAEKRLKGKKVGTAGASEIVSNGKDNSDVAITA